MNADKKYLSVQDRIALIKDIQDGKYIVTNKKGRIQKKINKNLFSEHCELVEALEKIADVSVVGKGAYGKAMKVCMPKGEHCEYEDGMSYSVKEIKFQDAGTYNTLINNPDRYENTEIRMLQFLSKFVFSQATPHINLPIMSFICQPSPHLPDRQFSDLVTKRITISELAEFGNLFSFMNGKLKRWKYNTRGWKVLFFQIFSVLATIHKYYPNFLHNDFKIDNLLVRSTKGDVNTHFKYIVNDIEYYIPDIGFQILLWDFDFSSIAGIIDNDKVIAMIDEDDANLNVHRNQYYDIHMCFGLMHRYWGYSMPNNINDWIEEFVLNDQIPAASRDERILEAKEYTTPAKLLRTTFFEEFTIKPTDSTCKATFTGKLETDIEFDFGNEENRYTNPDTCQYQNYVFLDPKNIINSQNSESVHQNRYLCKIASKEEDLIKPETMEKNRIRDWVLKRLKEYTISNVLSKNEQHLVAYTTLDLFNKFSSHYNITQKLLYAVVCCCMMYASFYHLLSYVFPFNDFPFWYAQPEIEKLNPGDLEDVYKQFTGFIAIYIEND